MKKKLVFKRRRLITERAKMGMRRNWRRRRRRC